MSTTTDGLLLRENAPISDSSDDTRGPDAAPTDNLHGNILDASQEASDEERCAAAAGPTNLSEGEVTTAGSDHPSPVHGCRGIRWRRKRQTHLMDSFTRVGSSRNTPRSYRQTNSIS